VLMNVGAPINYPYQDAGLPVEQRVEDLLGRMTVEQKSGILFQTMAWVGDPEVGFEMFGLPSLSSMIVDRHMNHLCVIGAASDGREFAAWHNAVQRIATERPLGIPVSFSSDPRHAFTDNPLTAALAGPFSQWPEPLGLAAIGSTESVAEFADIARQEYLAVGIRVALHPQIDLATEPRWARISGTFGEDVEVTSRLGVAYIRGFQGASLGPQSVATMAKHFPGGGPQKDGEDPHFDYGREQVYPGDEFPLHLKPFIEALAAGTSQIMPYYGMPVGTEYEEVGFAFNHSVIAGLLRGQLGFDGIVCTDWAVLTNLTFFGEVFPARAWGVEDLSLEARIVKVLDAGVDQIGGEHCAEALVRLVHDGRVGESRIDESVRRVLREKFVLGLFDAPFVDEARAGDVVGCAEFRRAGLRAQQASVTVLTNGETSRPMLPLGKGLAVYAEGVDGDLLGEVATVVDDPHHADLALLRVKAPYEVRECGFERLFHAGSLEFPASEMERLIGVCRTVPTVIDITLDRPAVLGALPDEAAAVVATYGCCDQALLNVLFGKAQPGGRLPFDVPSSMAAVVASREDVPFDTAEPRFRCGHGLRY
jgi:beta-glucosidase